MSWMQQREAIRRAADAGARPRISAQGSQILPLRGDRLQSALLTRPNGQLTRAGQFYHSITGRRPPSRQFDESQPLIRDGPNDYILTRGGVRKLVRSLQTNGQYHVTKLGKAFFKDKFTEWLAHVPVIIRGRRRNGTPYERHDYLPVTALEMGLSRQNDAWSDAQVARNVKDAVLRQLGQPGPDEPIYMISGEVYFLHPTNEWAYSSSSMQVIDNRVDTQIRLRQPLGALREVSYQLFAGDQILASAFEERQDMLCVPRQIAELLKLPLQEVMEDFNSICPGNWQQRGVSPTEIRTFCVWRNAPMFYVDCRGRLLDCFQPAEKEEKAIAFTSWNGHAFFYRSARAVAACDESEQRQRFRRLKRDNPVPEFKEWQLWEGEIKSGYFYTEDLRGVRAQLLAEGHQPKVSMRGLCEWSALRLRVVGGTDCVIRELCEDAQVLQEWTQRLGVPYRGQRLAGASLDVFLHLLQGKREDTRSRREELLARQQGMCKLCGAPITLGTFEIDHVIPVAQSFSGQQQELQALCLECHRTKTSLEGNHSTTLESRFCRYVYQNYTATPRLPPLVFQLQKWDLDRPCQGIDVCRCRKNGLANARLPLPVFCPLDCILPSEEGQLADLMWVDLPCDHRKGVLDRLPFVGKGWYAKPVCAYLLEAGLAQWQHFKWSLDATAHVDQRCLELVLERMEQNWPEGEEHYAKLAINSLVGLFARSLELVYSMKTSNHQVDGEGCSWRQTFTDSAGRTHWDHIFVTELLSNSSYRPIHDYIMGAEYVAVARIRQALAEVPRRYLKCIKTDCLVMQDVPKKYRPAVERLLRMSHRDGTPVYRYEEVAGLKGQYREPSMEAEPIRAKAPWRRVEDPVSHCLDGESLLLTGFPGTGKTHLAKKIVEALREHGDTVHIITKTHAAVQNVGLGAQTADHWVRRNVRNGHCSATWLVIEELTQLDTPLWADIACLSMNKKIRFLLLGDFRQLPAVLDSFAGAEVCRELKNSQLLHDLAGGWCHELSERWRFDEQIFEFLTWLRVDEAEQVSLPEALREARQRFPRRGEPDVSLVISHAKRLQINDRENRRLAPPGALVLRYEARGAVPTNAPQTMRVWPGLRLIGAGGKVQKGTFVTVEAVEGDVVRLESGQSFAGQELLKHTRLCSAITYASVQGLTLRGRVWLYDVESPHFTLKHLYMGCSRATSSELLSVL